MLKIHFATSQRLDFLLIGSAQGVAVYIIASTWTSIPVRSHESLTNHRRIGWKSIGLWKRFPRQCEVDEYSTAFEWSEVDCIRNRAMYPINFSCYHRDHRTAPCPEVKFVVCMWTLRGWNIVVNNYSIAPCNGNGEIGIEYNTLV